MLTLFGEGGADIGTQQVLVVPDSIQTKGTVKTLTDAIIPRGKSGCGLASCSSKGGDHPQSMLSSALHQSQPTQSLMVLMQISTHQ